MMTASNGEEIWCLSVEQTGARSSQEAEVWRRGR
jgi:hypothetical protein